MATKAKRKPVKKPARRVPEAPAILWNFIAYNGDFLGSLTFTRKQLNKLFPNAIVIDGDVYLAAEG